MNFTLLAEVKCAKQGGVCEEVRIKQLLHISIVDFYKKVKDTGDRLAIIIIVMEIQHGGCAELQ